jgi:hypothetical protein
MKKKEFKPILDDKKYLKLSEELSKKYTDSDKKVETPTFKNKILVNQSNHLTHQLSNNFDSDDFR